MSRSIDPQQPKTLSNNQLVQIGNHPRMLELSHSIALLCHEIILLYRKICKAKETPIYIKYAQLGKALSGKKQYQTKILSKHVQGIYCQEALINNIEKQLNRTLSLMDIDTADSIMIAFLERSRIIKTFFFRAILLVTENRSWRIEAIKDLTGLYALKETRHHYAAHQRGSFPNTNNGKSFPLKDNPLENEPLEGKPKRLGCISLKCEPLQSIFCLDERSLGNRQNTYLFNRLDSLQRHVKTHISDLTEDNKVYCPHLVCRQGNLSLNDISHFRNHIAMYIISSCRRSKQTRAIQLLLNFSTHHNLHSCSVSATSLLKP